MTISPLGDSALLADFSDESQDQAALLQRALAAAKTLDAAKLEGVIEVTSAYGSVALFLDLARIDEARLSSLIDNATQLLANVTTSKSHARRIEIPVCYDAEFALDAERVSKETGVAFDQIIALHSAASFTVACIGFMPGFPYLAGLPESLRAPRHTTPRTKVPARSVAIANNQAGIYPFDAPGGWNVIGRTPVRLFDAEAVPPALLAPGDEVRFRAISQEEFRAAVGDR